jgi:hypothetical protein
MIGLSNMRDCVLGLRDSVLDLVSNPKIVMLSNRALPNTVEYASGCMLGLKENQAYGEG